MAVYRVERPWSELGSSQTDLEAAGFRAIICLQSFPELRWLRSYWDPKANFSHCFYETEVPERIRDHAAAARIPCGAITPVVELTPATVEDFLLQVSSK